MRMRMRIAEDARSAVKLKRERVDLKGEMRPVGD